MSITLKVSNGDLDVDENRGVINTVTSVEKAGQDVARHLLSEFDAFFQEGNQLIEDGTGSVDTDVLLNEILVNQFISEAINRLSIKQQVANESERIIRVNQITTRRVGLTTLAFMVEVLFSGGQTATVVDTVDIKATQLDHIVNPGYFTEA